MVFYPVRGPLILPRRLFNVRSRRRRFVPIVAPHQLSVISSLSLVGAYEPGPVDIYKPSAIPIEFRRILELQSRTALSDVLAVTSRPAPAALMPPTARHLLALTVGSGWDSVLAVFCFSGVHQPQHARYVVDGQNDTQAVVRLFGRSLSMAC